MILRPLTLLTLALLIAAPSMGASLVIAESCTAWNLNALDFHACQTQWNAARSDAEREMLTRRYNPRYATRTPDIRAGQQGPNTFNQSTGGAVTGATPSAEAGVGVTGGIGGTPSAGSPSAGPSGNK